MSKASRQHLERVASLPCVLCTHIGQGESRSEIHHPRDDQGMGERASDWLAIALCPEHHRGKLGVHGLGTRAFERMYRLSELDLLALTIEAMHK